MSIISLQELLTKKRAEKNAREKAAVEARKTAALAQTALQTSGTTAMTTTPKPRKEKHAVNLEFNDSKALVVELLKLGDPDAETMAEIESRYAQFPDLKSAVEKQMISDAFRASRGYFKPHKASQTLVARGEFVEIAAERIAEISAELKRNKEATAAHQKTEGHQSDCGECKERRTFAYKNLIYKSRDEGGETHSYLVSEDKSADWLRNLLSELYKYQQGVEAEWDTLVKNAGANPMAHPAERMTALMQIAKGEAVATIATVTKDNPFVTPRYQDTVRVGEFTNFGDFLVRGMGIAEDGYPRLELVPFEQEHSRMYFAARRYFGGQFKYKTAQDNDPERAFYGLQDISGKPADALRALLRKALGAKLERHTTRDPRMGERLAGSYGATGDKPTTIGAAYTAAKAPTPAGQLISETVVKLPIRQVRRAQKFGDPKPEGDGQKPRKSGKGGPGKHNSGGARNLTLESQNASADEE